MNISFQDFIYNLDTIKRWIFGVFYCIQFLQINVDEITWGIRLARLLMLRHFLLKKIIALDIGEHTLD